MYSHDKKKQLIVSHRLASNRLTLASPIIEHPDWNLLHSKFDLKRLFFW